MTLTSILSLAGLLLGVYYAESSKDCQALDIHVLMDASMSVKPMNFVKQLDFVKTFAESFNIGQDAVRIGVTTFSTFVGQEFWMNKYTDIASLKAAIHRVAWTAGTTHTEKGLDFVKDAFSHAHGGRDGVRNILIVMTDGQSSKPSDTLVAADSIHKEDIEIYTIGIGDTIDKAELVYIATNISNVWTVDNFDGLVNIINPMDTTICGDPDPEISLIVSPSEIAINLTHTMRMSCALNDSSVSHLVSIVITRRGASGIQEIVATVSAFDEAFAATDLNTMYVNGTVLESPVTANYLSLTWDHPTDQQAASYSCEINAIDDNSRPVRFTQTVSVTSRVPSHEDIVHHVRVLEKHVDEQIAEMSSLQQMINALMARIDVLEGISGPAVVG